MTSPVYFEYKGIPYHIYNCQDVPGESMDGLPIIQVDLSQKGQKLLWRIFVDNLNWILFGYYLFVTVATTAVGLPAFIYLDSMWLAFALLCLTNLLLSLTGMYIGKGIRGKLFIFDDFYILGNPWYNEIIPKEECILFLVVDGKTRKIHYKGEQEEPKSGVEMV